MAAQSSMLSRAFYLTAVVNVVAALHAVAFPQMSRAMLYGLDSPVDAAASANHLMLWLFVGIFGVGYFKAARDERYVEPLLLLGGLGKLTAAIVWLSVLLGGARSFFLIQGIAFDGAFGTYFLLTLWRRRR